MLLDLQELAPHMLGVFMIALSCVPLIFVWRDRGRKLADRDRVAKLRREASVAARLRAQGTVSVEPRFAADWLGEARR